MNPRIVRIRELVGWDLDDYEYRPLPTQHHLARAQAVAARRFPFKEANAVLPSQTERLCELFSPHAGRADLLAEMSGLSWSLGVVDLRSLIAFQRRLYFSRELSQPPVPAADDWPALVDHSFGSTRPPEFERTHDSSSQTLILRSDNPNLHFRVTNDAAFPLSVHTGSPFFEIASFSGRWFLRDGYHRAYALMRAGVWEVPAVVVHASTIEELGANQPWFFPETILFSETPPLVADFLDDDLVLEYDRPRLIKTLRLTMEETLIPETTAGD